MLLNYFGKTTPCTPGATKEQMKLELELVEVSKQYNLYRYIEFCFCFTIIGAPIALIIHLVKGKKLANKKADLLGRIAEIQIKNAPR